MKSKKRRRVNSVLQSETGSKRRKRRIPVFSEKENKALAKDIRKFEIWANRRFPLWTLIIHSFDTYVWLAEINLRDKGKGYGTQIMEELQRVCKKHHAAISLQVASGEDRNKRLRFFDRLGFKLDYWKPFVRMTWNP